MRCYVSDVQIDVEQSISIAHTGVPQSTGGIRIVYKNALKRQNRSELSVVRRLTFLIICFSDYYIKRFRHKLTGTTIK